MNKDDETVQKVHEKTALVTRDKEAMRICRMREKALSDWTSGVNYARREGWREGRKEGAQEILNLLAQGKTIEEAKRILNLE